MTEYVEFPTFITKGIEIEKREDERRIFTGHITAEIIDKQQEFIFVAEVMKIMDIFMKIRPVISEVHTNRMVGDVLKYEKSSINNVASVKITAEIFKSDEFTLYDRVWSKIVKGEYRGLSMGGASKEREPIVKDGKMALELRKLELYEIAICAEPANPFAIIDHVNTFAKSNNIGQDRITELDGRCIIQCPQIGMCFEKTVNTTGLDMNLDVDIDNHQYKDDGGMVCDICGVKKSEHGVKSFDKPEEKEEVEKHHQVGLTDEEEYKDDKKVEKDQDTLTGRSASTRAENIGASGSSPKQNKDLLNQISRPVTAPKKIEMPQVKPAKINKAEGNLDPKPDPEQDPNKPIQNDPYKKGVHSFIEYFGEDQVRKALEERDSIRYMKRIIRKYD